MLPSRPSHTFPVYMQRELSFSSSTVALTNIGLLASSNSVSGLHEFRAVDNARHPFSDVLESSETMADLDNSINIQHNLHPAEKKRRLTNEQVKLLEVSFELESKLEPERKNHLAQELGLQPRQVAIWFQNRRARSKSKQIEQQYQTLKQQYDAVRSETDKLVLEVARLRNMLDAHVANGWGLRSANHEHEILRVTTPNPREYHLQEDQKILQSENPMQCRPHYQRSPSVQSECTISRHINLQGEMDNSSDSEQTISLEARMWNEKQKYMSDNVTSTHKQNCLWRTSAALNFSTTWP